MSRIAKAEASDGRHGRNESVRSQKSRGDPQRVRVCCMLITETLLDLDQREGRAAIP